MISVRSQGEFRVQTSLYPLHGFCNPFPSEIDCMRNKCASFCYFAEFPVLCNPFYFAGFPSRSCYEGGHFPGNRGQHIHLILNQKSVHGTHLSQSCSILVFPGQRHHHWNSDYRKSCHKINSLQVSICTYEIYKRN